MKNYFFALLSLLLFSSISFANTVGNLNPPQYGDLTLSDQEQVAQIIAAYYGISDSNVNVSLSGNFGFATADISSSALTSQYSSSIIELDIEIKNINGVRMVRVYHESDFVVEDDLDGI